MKVVLLGLWAVLLAAALPADSFAADNDVAQTLTAFYKWYVPHLDKKPGEKSSHKMSDFVTERLLARIDKLQKPKDDGVAELDWDPFLNAQDYEPDWGAKAQVSNVQVKGERATATVRVGGKEGSTVRLSLVRDGGRWKIDNFIPKL